MQTKNKGRNSRDEHMDCNDRNGIPKILDPDMHSLEFWFHPMLATWKQKFQIEEI